MYFTYMKICQKCKNEIKYDFFVGRETRCPSCGADLHCCLNCSFYQRGSYNDCRESQAERVTDKSRSNFCDYFLFIQTSETGADADSKINAILESLFIKDLNNT